MDCRWSKTGYRRSGRRDGVGCGLPDGSEFAEEIEEVLGGHVVGEVLHEKRPASNQPTCFREADKNSRQHTGSLADRLSQRDS